MSIVRVVFFFAPIHVTSTAASIACVYCKICIPTDLSRKLVVNISSVVEFDMIRILSKPGSMCFEQVHLVRVRAIE